MGLVLLKRNGTEKNTLLLFLFLCSRAMSIRFARQPVNCAFIYFHFQRPKDALRAWSALGNESISACGSWFSCAVLRRRGVRQRCWIWLPLHGATHAAVAQLTLVFYELDFCCHRYRCRSAKASPIANGTFTPVFRPHPGDKRFSSLWPGWVGDCSVIHSFIW